MSSLWWASDGHVNTINGPSIVQKHYSVKTSYYFGNISNVHHPWVNTVIITSQTSTALTVDLSMSNWLASELQQLPDCNHSLLLGWHGPPSSMCPDGEGTSDSSMKVAFLMQKFWCILWPSPAQLCMTMQSYHAGGSGAGPQAQSPSRESTVFTTSIICLHSMQARCCHAISFPRSATATF